MYRHHTVPIYVYRGTPQIHFKFFYYITTQPYPGILSDYDAGIGIP